MKGIILNGDCLAALKEMPSNVIDLVATDPPYGISFMGKDWDTFKEVVEPQGSFQHKNGLKKLPRNKPTGMYDFFLPIWKETLRVLKPGGFAFVMCAPRQDVHFQQLRALIDAGFDMSFSSIYWTYGSGFPKSHSITGILDKRKRGFDVQRYAVVSDEKPQVGVPDGSGFTVVDYTRGVAVPPEEKKNGTGGISRGAVNVGQVPAWIPHYETGHPQLQGACGGFQPKPAVEIIIVAMKPLSESTFASQAVRNRKGVTWLDDCRIPYADQNDVPKEFRATDMTKAMQGVRNNAVVRKPFVWKPCPEGRFPANLLVSDNVLGDHSKYFDLDKWTEAYPFLICPKASKKEKGVGNRHPTVKPRALMGYLIVLGSREGDVVLDPFAGSGTTLVAAKSLGRTYVGIELNLDYCRIIEDRIKGVVPTGIQERMLPGDASDEMGISE